MRVSNRGPFGPRRAFTVIEVLVAISVIGVLLALILPAVLAVREAARRTQCRNNIKQLALAATQHESIHGFLPSNGWGYLWYGEPGRGVGRRQPGGWIWTLLPHLEQDGLWDEAAGLAGSARRLALGRVAQSPLAVVTCPTRRTIGLSAHNPILFPRNADWFPDVATTDYAINEGDWISDTREGPASLAEGDNAAYLWPDMSLANGVSFLRSEVRTSMIRDGQTQTYLLGEKYVSRGGNQTGHDFGNDQAAISGVDIDINRWTTDPPRPDGVAANPRRFGSAHAAVCNMSFCDGSVRAISYSIDAGVHQRLGTRAEGLPAGGDVD